MEKEFSTLDSYLAGYLCLQGHQPALVDQGGKIAFVFDSTERLSRSISSYYGGASVKAAAYTACIKNLRGQIHGLRKRKMGCDDGNSRPLP